MDCASPLSVTGQISSASKVVKVSGGSGVFVGDECWVRHGEEFVVGEHALGDACAELLHLFLDVTEEGVAAPSAYEHDGAHWHVVKAHGHGSSGLHGVGSHFVRVIVKDISAC